MGSLAFFLLLSFCPFVSTGKHSRSCCYTSSPTYRNPPYWETLFIQPVFTVMLFRNDSCLYNGYFLKLKHFQQQGDCKLMDKLYVAGLNSSKYLSIKCKIKKELLSA